MYKHALNLSTEKKGHQSFRNKRIASIFRDKTAASIFQDTRLTSIFEKQKNCIIVATPKEFGQHSWWLTFGQHSWWLFCWPQLKSLVKTQLMILTTSKIRNSQKKFDSFVLVSESWGQTQGTRCVIKNSWDQNLIRHKCVECAFPESQSKWLSWDARSKLKEISCKNTAK